MFRFSLTVALLATPSLAADETAAPVCPSGFEIAQATETLFECRRPVAPEEALGLARAAGQSDCPNPRYWNFGPHVVTSEGDESSFVAWTCYHLKG